MKRSFRSSGRSGRSNRYNRNIKRSNKNTKVITQKQTDNIFQNFILPILFVLLLLLAILLISYICYILFNKKIDCENIQDVIKIKKTGWDLFDNNEELQSNLLDIALLICPRYIGFIPKVLYIDTYQKNKDLINSVDFNLLFPSEHRNVIYLDGEKDTGLNNYFYEKYPNDRPLIVVVKNFDRAKYGENFTYSFNDFFNNPIYQYGNRYRNSNNVAFILLGSTIPEDIKNTDCKTIPRHLENGDTNPVQFPSYFTMSTIRRITTTINLC